jgi:hypothetical protein
MSMIVSMSVRVRGRSILAAGGEACAATVGSSVEISVVAWRYSMKLRAPSSHAHCFGLRFGKSEERTDELIIGAATVAQG